ncbi:hypothetical protein FOL47_002746 [Perkinsus chesapeaki]|uniref:Uncharacterized protein n=1 Tax=Perkinsus chesapeaki TaxID=330153 RepID=A0A7J6KPF4_PERCH|nr:hypothetical protein FOL47_002746 [Perkinsus chesapeaki]
MSILFWPVFLCVALGVSFFDGINLDWFEDALEGHGDDNGTTTALTSSTVSPTTSTQSLADCLDQLTLSPPPGPLEQLQLSLDLADALMDVESSSTTTKEPSALEVFNAMTFSKEESPVTTESITTSPTGSLRAKNSTNMCGVPSSGWLALVLTAVLYLSGS